MALNIEKIKSEIDKQLETYRAFIKMHSSSSTSNNVGKEILTDERLMAFYSRTDSDAVLQEYIIKINKIANMLFEQNDSIEKRILKALEYIRYMAAFDNIKDDEDFFEILPTLSQSSISQIFLGTGVCASIARLLRDILYEYDTQVLTVRFADSNCPGIITEEHDVLVMKINEEMYYIDPTWYSGSIDSLTGSKKVAKYGTATFSSINANQESLDLARKEVSFKLIEELELKNVVESLIT